MKAVVYHHPGHVEVNDDIITHRVPLEQAPHAYEIFCEKKEGGVKVVLKP